MSTDYCENCKRFTPRYFQDGSCQNCGRPHPRNSGPLIRANKGPRMSVRAKFKVDSKTEHFYSGKKLITINMSPVGPKWESGKMIPDAENSKFWDASPSGEFKLGTVNIEAATQIELGKEYYLDITPAE